MLSTGYVEECLGVGWNSLAVGPGLLAVDPWGVDSLAVGLVVGRFRLRQGEAEV